MTPDDGGGLGQRWIIYLGIEGNWLRDEHPRARGPRYSRRAAGPTVGWLRRACATHVLESSVSSCARTLVASTDSSTCPMPDFLAAEELDTLTKARVKPRPDMRCDVIVIGAGPTGLACAIEAQKIGLKVIVVDKGCLVNSLFHYPANMSFFTTPELLEIGDIPFTTAQQKPTREEALEYYRKVAEHYHLDVRQYEWVKTVMGEDENFSITATDRAGRPHDYHTRKVIVSTGYYDLANQLGIPGEELPKVSHYYGEPHPYYDT